MLGSARTGPHGLIAQVAMLHGAAILHGYAWQCTNGAPFPEESLVSSGRILALYWLYIGSTSAIDDGTSVARV